MLNSFKSHKDEKKQMISDKLPLDDAALDDKKLAIVYAYRYLLNREPENTKVIESDTFDWRVLRERFMQSPEYKSKNPVTTAPYQSLRVEGITYFYNSRDKVIPSMMYDSGFNYSKHEIDSFIDVADSMFYKKQSDILDFTGNDIFLDIGGNIGTTSIYCKLKLKPQMRFIAFEPVHDNATLFTINSIINGINNDITVERIALSNETTNHRVVAALPENMGGSFLAEPEAAEMLMQQGRIIESVCETTLDAYLSANQISGDRIKYIWIDVEGHETDVLEGAAGLLKNYRIPCCMEFNQKHYKDGWCYEKMIKMLEVYFDYFVPCQQWSPERQSFVRPISELDKLWEEFDHRSCDLILF